MDEKLVPPSTTLTHAKTPATIHFAVSRSESLAILCALPSVAVVSLDGSDTSPPLCAALKALFDTMKLAPSPTHHLPLFRNPL